MSAKKTTKPTKKTTPKKLNGQSLISDNTKLELIIPAQDATAAYKKSLTQLSKKLKSDGFRSGKVPAKIAEERIGREEIVRHALQQLLPTKVTQLLAEHKKQTISSPEYNVVSALPDEDWKVEVLIAEKPEVKLGKYKSTATKAIKSAVAELKKLKVEAKKEGKDAPKGHGHQHSDEEHTLESVYKALIVEIQPQVPELVVRRATQEQLQELGQQLKQIKLSIDEYLEKRSMTFEQLSTEYASRSLAQIQLELILDAIAIDQKLAVNDKDIEAYISTQPAEIQDQFRAPHLKERIERNLLRQKINQFLLQST